MTKGDPFKSKKEIKGDDRSLKRVSLFFVSLFLLFNIVIYMLSEIGWFFPFIDFTTVSSAFLMNLFGIDAQVSVDNIFLQSQTFIVTLECTAIFIIAIYSSLVIAYPADLRRKLIGLSIGIPAIIAANILRLLILATISERLPGYFEYVHDYLWQIAFILLISSLWVVWVGRGSKIEGKTAIHS